MRPGRRSLALGVGFVRGVRRVRARERRRHAAATRAHCASSTACDRHGRVAGAGGNAGDDARLVALSAARRRGVRSCGRDYDSALTLASRPALATSALADYAAYYKGLAQLRLNRAADARTTFEALRERNPWAIVSVSAALGAAEAATALADHDKALTIYEKLTADKTTVNEQILARQAETARVLGDRKKTAEALLRIYYEFPLTDAAIAAAAELEPLRDIIQRQGYKLDLGRAAQLYGARRYSDARAAFVAVQAEAGGDDRELADLRIAESDYFLQRYAAAVDGLRPWLDRAARQAEARFFYLSALRGLGKDDEFLAQTQALVPDFPDSTWSEEALNNLGTYYIVKNDDAQAAKVFVELYREIPEWPARRARRMEVGLVGVQERQVRRDGSRFRKRRRGVSSLGLPAAIPLLVGALARQAWRRGPRLNRGFASS